MRPFVQLLVLAGSLLARPAIAGREPPNAMHPPFAVLDDSGAPVTPSGAPPSSLQTCGTCHDATYINAHNSHFGDAVQAGCIECHFDGSRAPTDPAAFDESGLLRREALHISAPRDENCAHCHGMVQSDTAPLRIPADYPAASDAPHRTYALTLATGEILSPQNVSDSLLNLRDKAAQARPWDVHARRLVGCTACHFAPNNPARAALKHTTLDFLVRDPRRIAVSEFLQRPDHDLVAASCESCHDPMKVHEFLPYKKRHMDALDCQSCHAPQLLGPAAQAIDETLVTVDGAARIEYRGVTPAPGETLNTAFTSGYAPALVAAQRPAAVGGTRIAPFNFVTRWSWVSRTTGEKVPLARLKAALVDGGRYRPEVLAALDGNGDRSLDVKELLLDTPEKVAAIATRLVAAGVTDPIIRAEIEPHAIRHAVQSGKWVRRDCASCHSDDSRLDAAIPLASTVPGGVLPDVPGGGAIDLDGAVVIADHAGLALRRGGRPGQYYVFGHSRDVWSNRLGLLILVAVLLGIAVDGGLRLHHGRRRGPDAHPATTRVYLYPAYERLWHWLMAASVLLLMATGFQIHFNAAGSPIALPVVVQVHNLFAAVMVGNAFLSLFYHMASDAIRQFVPNREDLPANLMAQIRYYASGIFHGHSHPVPKTVERKLNPLQQLTYLALLNLLFPLQVATGVIILGASRWPDFAASVHGLTIVAPIHNLGSWLFLSFFLLHLYLTTTGRTVLSNIHAMVDGWDEIDTAAPTATGGLNG